MCYGVTNPLCKTMYLKLSFKVPEKHRRVVPEPKVPAAPKDAPGVKGINLFLVWVVYLQEGYVCLTVLCACVNVGSVCFQSVMKSVVCVNSVNTLLNGRTLQISHLNILSHLPSHLTNFSEVPEVHKKAVPKEKVPVPVPKRMEAPPARGI